MMVLCRAAYPNSEKNGCNCGATFVRLPRCDSESLIAKYADITWHRAPEVHSKSLSQSDEKAMSVPSRLKLLLAFPLTLLLIRIRH
jgi:hypothetical protein